MQILTKVTQIKTFKPLLAFLLSLQIGTIPNVLGAPIEAVRVDRKVAQSKAPPTWESLFEITRDALSRRNVRAFLREVFKAELSELVKRLQSSDTSVVAPNSLDISETQFMMLLRETPEIIPMIQEYLNATPRTDVETLPSNETPEAREARLNWRKRFRELIARNSIKEKFLRLGNPLTPLVLNSESDPNGYRDLMLYVNHPWKMNGKAMPVANLKQVWMDVISRAKKEIIINVFDFDLDEVADALIEKRKNGLSVFVGIDKGVIAARPEVKAVADKLIAGNVELHPVDSVGLNHQKLLVIDWTDPSNAESLMSSGNLTQSCSGPEGDLKNLNPRPRESIPNANHLITVKGQTLATVLYHELAKTVVKPYQLRGNQYPLGGTYRIYGVPFGNKKSKESSQPYLQISFSPNGAFNNVNNNVIGNAIRQTDGPMYMAQFAFSSKDVEKALLERAKSRPRRFELYTVGDTPFAMQDWSIFLSISGFELKREAKIKTYLELKESPWLNTFGAADFATLRSRIRIAPPVYGMRKIKFNSQTYDVSAKIHHKTLVTGKKGKRIAITGSFNFSSGAESNQEYIVAYFDERVSDAMTGFIKSLYDASPRSVADEAKRRNNIGQIDEAVDPGKVDAPKDGAT